MGNWSPLNFGRYEGKSLPQVLFSDPDWFFWALEKDGNIFERHGHGFEAKAINRKARSVKIPEAYGNDMLVEIGIHPDTGGFTCIEIVPKDRPLHQGATRVFREPLINLSVVRRIRSYDKTGCKLLIKQLKHILFGNGNIRLTKKKCEDFFSNDANFDL